MTDVAVAPINPEAKKAGLTLPAARVSSLMREGRYAKNLTDTAPVFMTAALEYLLCELVEEAAHLAQESDRKRITPRHIQLAINSDAEFAELLRTTTISSGGVMPHIASELIPQKKGDMANAGPKSGKKKKSKTAKSAKAKALGAKPKSKTAEAAKKSATKKSGGK
jgi:histone H2A